MTKEIEWKGAPSQLLNIGIFLSGIFIVTLPLIIFRWKHLKSTVYEIGKNAVLSRNLLEKKEESIKIEDINNILIERPLFLRILNLSNLIITSNQNKSIVFAGLNKPEEILLQLENNKNSIKF